MITAFIEKNRLMKHLIILLFIALPLIGFSQNDIPYTHFVFNKMAYNPAYTGNKKSLDLMALYRNQWSGIDGAPTTGTFSLQIPFFSNRNAIGLAATSDKIGQINTTALDLSYAYHIKTSDKVTLSLGLNGRIEQASIDWESGVRINIDDEAIPMGTETVTTPNFGFGAYLSSERYYIGVSAPRLLKNSLYLDRNNTFVSNREITTWYMLGGVLLPISRQIDFAPSFLVSYNQNAPTDLDINANFIFLQSLWVGLSYRWEDSIDALIGYEFKNGLRIGMGYDFTVSELNKVTNGSYEVMLGYTFRCKDCHIPHLRYF